MRRTVAIGIFLFFLALLTFLPRLPSLSLHWASDEDLWMQRSRDFYFALEERQFRNTFTAYHPGVTTCWLGSLAIWYTHRHYYFKGWFSTDYFLSPEMLAFIRFPISVVTGILILVAGLLLYRMFSSLLAGVSALYLAIEPFLLSESRRAHTDALAALFLFLALLLWLCYLEEGEVRHRRVLFSSGICFGLACLTKSHAGAFLIFLPVMLVWYQRQFNIYWVQLLMSALLWISAAFLTVIVIWPYLWTVKFGSVPLSPFLFFGSGAVLLWSWKKLSIIPHFPFTHTEYLLLGVSLLMVGVFSLYAVSEVIAMMYDALTRAHELPTLFLGDLRYNPGPLYFPVMCLVWSAPLTIPLMGFAVYRAWQKRYRAKQVFRVVMVLILFALFYLIGLSLVSKKISRYIVIILPAFSFLSALGAIQFAQFWNRKWLRYLVLAVLFVLQAVPILRLHPYYRTYHHPLLSGKWVEENTSCITGAGLDLAADYLNALPNAQHLRVRTTWFSKDLAHYFVGEAKRHYNSEISPPDFDYDVEYLYDRQMQGIPVDSHPKGALPPSRLRFSKIVPRKLEHVIHLNGIDYVWIYRVQRGEN